MLIQYGYEVLRKEATLVFSVSRHTWYDVVKMYLAGVGCELSQAFNWAVNAQHQSYNWNGMFLGPLLQQTLHLYVIKFDVGCVCKRDGER
jgi:hypothetical protein